MVRNIVGSLVYVGRGKYSPSWLAQVLAGRDRARAAPTFAASGLYLRNIKYETKWRLPQQGRIILETVVDRLSPLEMPHGR
jgi:tRNA pseudouridine38-40 synthase